MAFGDITDYKKLSVIKSDFVELHFTDSTNYQLNSLEVPHNLGFVPIALVTYWESVGTEPDVSADNFNGTPLPDISEGFSSPWTPYAYNKFMVDKESLVIYKQSMHTSSGLNFHMYFRYYLLAQAANS